MKAQNHPKGERVIVLDTSAFVAGFDPFALPDQQVTVPKVEEEIRRSSMTKTRLEAAIESGKLKVQAPTPDACKKVNAFASQAGDVFKLSETDLQLLSVALELKEAGYSPQVITDDYSIQNVAKRMGVEFVALATFGIKRVLEWVRYCPACHREYPANAKFGDCQVCGTELKRKPRRQPKK
jgi:UPF0271 protein